MNWDALIVGSGLGGLTCGVYLTHYGKKVLVLEQDSVPGGFSHMYRRKGAYRFDIGVHIIGDSGPGSMMRRIIDHVGLTAAIPLIPMDPDGFDVVHLPDATVRVPLNADEYEARLQDLFPHERDNLARYFRVIRAIYREAVWFLERNTALSALLAAPFRMPTLSKWALKTQRDLITTFVADPKLQTILHYWAHVHLCLPSNEVSAVLHALVEMNFHQANHYPRGGGDALSRAAVRSITEGGGAVWTSTLVERILVKAGRARGVLLESGEEITAPVVISNADIKRTFLGLVGPEHLPQRFIRKAQNWQFSPSFYLLSMATDLDVRPQLGCSNHYVLNTYDLDGHILALRNGEFRPRDYFAVTSQTAKDPFQAYAPEGEAVLQVFAPAPYNFRNRWHVEPNGRRGGDYRRTKAEVDSCYLQEVNKLIPGLSEHIRWSEGGTPVTAVRYSLATDGNYLGLSLARSQMPPQRPGPEGPIKGLYTVGASTTLGPGVPACMASGVMAAGLILDRDLRRTVLFARSSRT